MKRIAAFIIIGICLLSLFGCAAKPAPAPASTFEAQPGEHTAEPIPVYDIARFTIGTTIDIEKAAAGEYNYDVLASGVSELPLVQQNADGEYLPLLANWETEDAQTWAYTIQPGMYWSDGEPVTVTDILFTLEYEDSQGSANFVSQTDSEGNVTPAKYLEGTLSENADALSLTLTSPNVRELSNMTSFRVLPEHLLHGNDNPTEEQLRVCCGPYVLQSYDRDAGLLTYTTNPYYPETPRIQTLCYRLFDSEDTMYMALMNGDIDMVWNYSAGVSGSYLDVVSGSDAVTLYQVSAVNAPAVLAFNNASGAFASEALRKAVSCALDYETLRSYVGSEQAVTANLGFAPPATVGYAETAPLVTDSEKADAYMQEAGYHRNEAGHYVNEAGEPFSFTLSYRSDKTVQVSCAELIKTALEQFGIGVTLEALDSSSYNAKTSNKFSENHITMEAALYGFTAAGMGMGNGLGSIYVDGNHPVQGGCQVFDAEFQAILGRMSAAGDPEAYSAAATELQQYYAAHIPMIALYWDSMSYAASSAYTGLTADAVFGLNHVGNWFSIRVK